MSEVLQFFRKLFDTSDWPGRWHCGRWSDFHGWLYILSDLAIWSAYFAIPAIILRYIVRQRKQVRFDRLYFLFAAFILACGTTHFVDAMIFWVPAYRVSALLRLFTGILSWLTVWQLVKLLPTAFSLKTSKELEQEVRLRELAESAMQKQNKMLNESQQMAAVGSWEWDIKTGKITWSDEQYRIWGLPVGSELPYDFFKSTIHPADREYHAAHIERALKTRDYPTFYHRIITPDGQVRHILARGEVETNGNGETVRIAGTSQNVTQLKHDEMQLLTKSLQLERKADELEQFAYVASHDLQEPLRKISSFATMLQSSAARGISAEEQNALIGKIVNASGRMQQLINDILDFSRVSNIKLEYSRVDLASVLRIVKADMDMMIAATGTKLEIGALPEVDGIPGQLQQVFQNLLSNAIKFRIAGVTPQISISCEALTGEALSGDAKTWLRQYLPEMTALDFGAVLFYKIDVRDNGIGFDTAYSNKIFQIFERLHGRSEYEGTGIGLAVVKRIIDNHHGFISASSAPGEGAKFTLILPSRQEAFITL